MGGLRGWDRDQKTAFSEYGHFAYQIKGNDTYSNMLVNILPVDPHDPRGGGGVSKGQTSTFSEHGDVAYQIKGNHECSKMQAHILSLHTPSTPGKGPKVKTFFFRK